MNKIRKVIQVLTENPEFASLTFIDIEEEFPVVISEVNSKLDLIFENCNFFRSLQS